jgi:hypothetical protein
VPVAQACTPGDSGGKDQEDHGSKPACANSSRDPISKKSIAKKAGRVAQGIGPEFKPQYRPKKKKRKNERKKPSTSQNKKKFDVSSK